MTATKFKGTFHGGSKKKTAKKKTAKKKATKARALGAMPTHLTPAQRKAWQEIVKAAPPGILGAADRVLVEQASICMAKMREGFHYNASKELRACLVQMQMTPSARSGAEPKKPGTKVNPFADD